MRARDRHRHNAHTHRLSEAGTKGQRGALGGGISWKWVGLSLLVVLAVQLLFGGIGIALGSSVAAALLAFLAYFLGGMLIGRLSPGVTIKEPAIAATILVIASAIAQIAAVGTEALAPGIGTLLISLVFSILVAYGITYLGARLGERLPGAQRVSR